ncbi:nucleotide exchange factor GrpE [Novosphingopyxis sp.]|uniref:nucleotide exchange factor GrpE n=1 Tax=Novosphingopyxis sp. TaxID=2709690 RepID=UPI003B5A8DAB
MTDDKQMDEAAEKELAEAELKGVPEALREETAETAPELKEHDRLAELESQLAEARQNVLYAQAETQNVRRRAEKDAADARNYAATGFARDVLSVNDNLQRALDAIPTEVRDEEKWRGLITGIEATGRELENVFGKHGITRVAAKGLPLDPNVHQAMMEIPSDEAEPGTVVQEIQAGYMIKDRLLRPALVGVAKKAE